MGIDPKLALLAGLLLLATGCYHFQFQQQPDPPPSGRLVEHEVRVPTYLNGFVGTGEVDTTAYCERPVYTELRVTAVDVLLSVATLLIYTPHTLYVTCEESSARAEATPSD